MNTDSRDVRSIGKVNTKIKYCSVLVILFVFSASVTAKKSKGEKPSWAQKPISEFSDADVEKLYEQWEEDEEPLEDDELPEHLRKQPELDWSKIDFSKPDALIKASKKGKTVMSFVSLIEGLSEEDCETTTKLWQSSLWNNHIQAERYVLEKGRALYVFRDGAQAWDAKAFFIQQEECKDVAIEGKIYAGKGHPNPDDVMLQNIKREMEEIRAREKLQKSQETPDVKDEESEPELEAASESREEL